MRWIARDSREWLSYKNPDNSDPDRT